MSQQKDNSGVIFQNDRKSKDTDPDGKGSAVIDGVSYWVASWVNESKDGVVYKSLKFTRKDDQGQGQRSQPARQSAPAGPRPTKAQATADAQRYQQRAIPPQDARQAPAAAARPAPARQQAAPPIQEQEPAGPPGDETHFMSEDIPFVPALA